MKNLKDYLGKKVAIACRTDAEAKFVNDFLANDGGRSLYSDWENRKNRNKEYHNCLEFGLDDLPYNSYCYEGYYEKQGYTVYKASEFIEHNTSLVGRYVKALVTNPNCIGGTKIGDLFLIIFDNDENTKIKRLSDNTTNWNLSKVYLGVQWELMPIDFNPNELLKEFPSEGCVYDNIKNLEPLTKYLLNRPFNNPNTEINKSDAIGIGWNKTSCWWLKTKESKKTLFNLSDLKQFLPNVIQEEPFAIQLNSQEELDAIMSFYKEKGYEMEGCSDYYHKGFVVYIKPKNKTWQTAHSNDRKYPFKTLSELGIILNNTPEFKIGKWYKNIGKDNKAYAKCLRYDGVNFYISEHIGHDKSYNLYENSSYFTKENYSKATLLTDLSEIQQYLPKRHSDKIVNNNSMYKVRDFVLANGSEGAGGWSSQVVQLLDLSVGSNCGGRLNKYSDFVAKLLNGRTYTIANSNIERKAKLEEIKTDLLSEDELLQVAKQFYPIGTKFRTIYGDNKTGTVKFNDANYFKKHRNPLNITVTVEEYEENCPKWSIYSKEKGWAKIINSPIQESDNFVLPEKWYCKRTKENSKILNEWNNKKYNSYAFCERGEGCMFSDKNYSGTNLTNYGDYQEITFEQFKKYVLGKSEVVKENESGLTAKLEKVRGNYKNPVYYKYAYDYDKPVLKETPSKNLLNPEIIPIKVRNLPKFEIPTRIKTVIIEPELLKI